MRVYPNIKIASFTQLRVILSFEEHKKIGIGILEFGIKLAFFNVLTVIVHTVKISELQI